MDTSTKKQHITYYDSNSEGFGEGHDSIYTWHSTQGATVYKKIPTELWYIIMEYLGFAGALKRKRCIFLTTKGTVCKFNRINCDCGSELWCKMHAFDIMNETDETILNKMSEMIGQKRLDAQTKLKYTDHIGFRIMEAHKVVLKDEWFFYKNFALYYAASYGMDMLVKDLLEAGANPKHVCTKKEIYCRRLTPIMMAIFCGHYDIVKRFITYGYNINSFSGNRNPLLLCIEKNRPEILKLLIKAGADVNVRSSDSFGFTGCMLAADLDLAGWNNEQESLTLLKILIEGGADYTMKSERYLHRGGNNYRSRYTAIELAQISDCNDIVKYLSSVEKADDNIDRWEHITRSLLQ